MQLAKTQSCSLEIFAAQQKSQIDVYQELTRVQQRERAQRIVHFDSSL